MKIGLRVPPCESLHTMVDFAKRAETAGFDYLWMPDSQLLWRDVWTTLGAVAAGTDRINLGTNVTNPVTREAAVTAGAAATVVEAAPDRFILGIGVGDSSVRIQGRRPARMNELTSYVDEVRTLLQGHEISGADKTYRMVAPPGRPVPIYVSATGPKMLRLGGEIGDGVIFVGGIDEEALIYATDNIGTGAERAGRDVASIDLAVGCFAYVGDDIEYGMRLMRPYAAVFALRHPDLLGDEVATPGREKDLGFYPDLGHARNWDAAIEATDWVPDEVLEAFCDRYCLIGDGPAVRKRVDELSVLGIDNLYVRGVHSYRLPDDVLIGFADHVIQSTRT